MSGAGPAFRALAGVDGCRAGWIAVADRLDGDPPEILVFPGFGKLLDHLGGECLVAVDMPIGLPDFCMGGGRGPEQAVRPYLGQRQSSVFSIPPRAAVEAEDYREACRLALESSDPPRMVSKQAFHLFPKIREIDRLLRADVALRARVIECHPEFSFCVLNSMRPMALPKKVKGRVNPAGIAERIELLVAAGLPRSLFAPGAPRGADLDDLVDASVNLLIARRHAAGLTRTYPSPPGADGYGIPIAIHG